MVSCTETPSTLACTGCGAVFQNMSGLGNHAKYSKTCTTELRFWGKVDKSGGADACWPWLRAITSHGYGCVTDGKDRVKSAHKSAYEYAKGPVPQGLHVMHSCDNRICCNPAHLKAGTRSDNMAGMAARGRVPKTNPRKLTPQKALEIRALQGKATSGQVAKQYGITQSYVFGVWGRRVWRNV